MWFSVDRLSGIISSMPSMVPPRIHERFSPPGCSHSMDESLGPPSGRLASQHQDQPPSQQSASRGAYCARIDPPSPARNRRNDYHKSCPIGPDTELVQFSRPNLGGRLALYGSPSTEVWTHVIASFGGVRFRLMDLRMSAGCASTLINACADTLETLRFGGMRDDTISE